MSVSLDDVPAVAAAAWLHLRGELQQILTDDLVSLWGWGSTVYPERPRRLSDLDTHVVVNRRIDDPTWEQIQAALDRTARAHGVAWDIGYTLADDAGSGELPHPVRIADQERREVMWAVHRAHWLAGWYVLLYGVEPERLVKPPTWPELQYALGRELEHLERHVIDGPHDAYEGRCALFNGARILYALESHDATLSKRGGGIWGLANLPPEWHDVLRIADRSYDGEVTQEEEARLVAAMGPFVAMVRERMPELPDKPPGSLPRWSV